MAASAGVFVRVVGAGGHGARPQDARDPSVVACEMVTALQTMVTRRFDVFDPVVLTVGAFHAGTRRNVIPDDATFEATVRTFSAGTAEKVRGEILRLCEHIAAAYGLEVDARFEGEYPATVNDPGEHDFVASTVRDLFGEERYETMPNPMSGSEDFSRVLQRVPGAFVFLGACVTDDPAAAAPNHSPRAIFDDSVLADSATLLAQLALRKAGHPINVL
jgi:hippurate hydrolase